MSTSTHEFQPRFGEQRGRALLAVLLATAVLSTGCAPVTPAEPTFTAVAITGTVLDPSRAPVAGARVYFVAGPVALPEIAALTDSAGAFSLSAPAPGDYTVGASADGFTNATATVTVPPATALTIQLTTTP